MTIYLFVLRAQQHKNSYGNCPVFRPMRIQWKIMRIHRISWFLVDIHNDLTGKQLNFMIKPIPWGSYGNDVSKTMCTLRHFVNFSVSHRRSMVFT